MAVETPTLKTKKRKADQLREDNDEAEEAEQTEFKIEEGDTD